MDGTEHEVPRWDLIIAHPPCTYLSMVATRSHSLRCTPLEKINARTLKRIEAMKFFMQFVNAPCDRIAIENPRGVMNTVYRQPDQTIHPYMFAENEQDTENYVTKATCLWLKGLKPLEHKADADESKACASITQNTIKKPNNFEMWGTYPSGKSGCWEDCASRDAKERSKTFPAIAEAFAEQWGTL